MSTGGVPFIVPLIFWGIVVALPLGFPGAYGCQALKTESFCLERGWPDAKISWTFKGYCIKRVDQTDIVIPVSQLK